MPICLHGIANIKAERQKKTKILEITFFKFPVVCMESPIYEAARKKENFENCIFLNFHFSAWARQCKGQSAKNVRAWNRLYKGQRAKNKKIKIAIFKISACLHGIANIRGRSQKTIFLQFPRACMGRKI